MSEQFASTGFDVTVIGGGLAGKAAAVHLARAGLKVICIAPKGPIRPPVGESLDWSAPELLRVLGLPMDELLGRQIATWKRHVTVKLRDGCSEQYVPTPALAGPPFHIELRTLHVARPALDDELEKIATDSGVTWVLDKVTGIEKSGNRVASITTASGTRFTSPWYIDASGSGTRLLAREFNLPSIQYGPTKVAMWTYLPVTQSVEGTTLYMDPKPAEYLDWVWEIPVSPQLVSVGYVTTGPGMKAKREQGLTPEGIFREGVMRYPRFESRLPANVTDNLSVTSFQCRVHTRVAGPNWLIAGEAASMVDPMTSNGVTAALRQGAEAAELIVKYRKRSRLSLRARLAYSYRVAQVAKFFNAGIEKMVYEPPVRNHIGVQRSGVIYTSPAWSMNVVYARLQAKGIFSTLFLSVFLGAFRASASLYYSFCKRFRPGTESAS